MPPLIRILSLITALVSAGCADLSPSQPALPEGPTAILVDSHQVAGSRRTDIFFVATVDEKAVYTSYAGAYGRNLGFGTRMAVQPDDTHRLVPAGRPTRLVIVAKTYLAAPVLHLFEPSYEIKGKVEFTPEVDVAYVVKGDLSETYQAVWLEEQTTGRVIGAKFEKRVPQK